MAEPPEKTLDAGIKGNEEGTAAKKAGMAAKAMAQEDKGRKDGGGGKHEKYGIERRGGKDRRRFHGHARKRLAETLDEGLRELPGKDPPEGSAEKGRTDSRP